MRAAALAPAKSGANGLPYLCYLRIDSRLAVAKVSRDKLLIVL
jgi:hypothetical protein